MILIVYYLLRSLNNQIMKLDTFPFSISLNHLHKMTAVSKLLLLFILSNIHNQTQGKKYLTELKGVKL